MGSVQLHPINWIGPAFGPGSQLSMIDNGDTSVTGGLIFFGNGAGDFAPSSWNHIYLGPPTLPGGVLPVALQTTWFLNGTDPGIPITESVVFQCFPEPYTAGEVRVNVPLPSTPTAYAVNFNTWDPAWPLNSLRLSFLANGLVSATELIAVLYYASPPSSQFSFPATNGTVLTTTVRPQFQWTYAAGDLGGPQVAFRTLIYTAAQTTQAGFVPGTAAAVWDSGIVRSGTPAYTMPVNLANNTNYVAYLTVAQRVNGIDQWANGWATRSFAIQIPPPAVPARPTITATPDNANARITLNVTQSGATPAWSHVLVERTRDAGTTWETVRSGDIDIAAGVNLTTWDYEIGNGELVRYRATAEIDTTVGGLPQVSVSPASALTPFASWSSSSIWLKVPLNPVFNQIVDLRSQTTETRRNPRGAFDVQGRKFPVVVSDIRRASEGPLVFYTATQAQTDALNDAFDLADTLLLQFPPGEGWGSRYVSIGDVTAERVVPEVAFDQKRFISASFIEVDAPVGDSLAFVTAPAPIPGAAATWAALALTNADWATVVARYPTWFDVYGARTLSWAEMPVYGTWAAVVSTFATWAALTGGAVSSTGSHLLDAAGNPLTDAAGNRLTA